ncbi:hypothetical protein [Mucilaginibacter ginkgonis]|uniref:Uncharacterized protein n=1 Tax=Mucilaginibacter ginkgonis TaxID=2682091 RepID=A0A6I4HWV2_9SPHI|nr:hypothetical protein [Mucilaginibacter ginkgonis]QQL49924.1 hypothetical protein GO620_000285 [Mucilaginibacter ginkgonis]
MDERNFKISKAFPFGNDLIILGLLFISQLLVANVKAADKTIPEYHPHKIPASGISLVNWRFHEGSDIRWSKEKFDDSE